MRQSQEAGRRSPGVAAGLVLLAALAGGGCQSQIGGQTLPSAHWLNDDVQYFAPGHEFMLQKEADAMRAFEGNAMGPGQPLNGAGN